MKNKVLSAKKYFDKDGYWFTTKSGKHIFVEKGKTTEDYKEQKKQEIDRARGNLWGKADAARIGYEGLDTSKRIDREWFRKDPEEKRFALIGDSVDKKHRGKYLTKEGKFTEDINKAYILNQLEFGKFKEAYDKSGYLSYDFNENRVDKLGKNIKTGKDEYIDFEKWIGDYEKSSRDNISQGRDLSLPKYYDNARIDTDKANQFRTLADKAAGGNNKSESRRAELYGELSNKLSDYYRKNPINISDEEIETYLSKKTENIRNAQFAGLDYLAREKDAIRRAKTGDIYLDDSNPYLKYATYNQVVGAGNKVMKENPDHWNAYQDFAVAIARQDKENPIAARRNFGNTRIIEDMTNTDYLGTVSNEDGYNRYRTWTSRGHREGFYDSYPDVYIDRSYVNKKDGTKSRYQRNADDVPAKTLTAEVNWGSIGSMDIERAEHEANKINKAIDFAKKVESIETKYLPSERRKLNSYSDMVAYYLNQGMSKQAAQRMAKWYINNRKRK